MAVEVTTGKTVQSIMAIGETISSKDSDSTFGQKANCTKENGRAI